MADHQDNGVVTVDRDESTVVNGPPVHGAPVNRIVAALSAAEQAKADTAAKAAREAILVQADKMLGQATSILRKGEKEYTKKLLTVCGLVAGYVGLSVEGGCDRDYAVTTTAGEFSKALRETVKPARINEMIRVHYAVSLLAGGKDVSEVPYNHLRDAYCLLVERKTGENRQDVWSIIPHVKSEALALFADTCATASKLAIEQRVAALVNDSAQKVHAENVKIADEKRAAREERERVQREALAVKEAAEKAAKDAAAKDAAAKEEASKPNASAEDKEAAASAAKELAAKELAAKHAAAKEAQESLAAKVAKREEAKVNAVVARSEERADKAVETADRKATVGQPGQILPNIARQAKRGAPKDRAESAVEILAGGDGADEAIREFFRLAQSRKEFSDASKRAIKGAIIMLARAENATEDTAAA